MRRRNTDIRGGAWSPAVIEAVWRKAHIVPRYDPAAFRKDTCDAWIARNEYGLETDHGWEIDHIVPVARGGGDGLDNLQPLLWQNNRHKSDNWPNWSCLISAA